MPRVLDRPPLADQPQQSFWLGPQAGEEVVGPRRLMALAIHGAGNHLDNTADASTVRSDVIRSFLGPHLPDGVPAMLFTLSCCGEGDLVLALELVLDLVVQGFLVAYSFGEDCAYKCQERLGPIGEAPAKAHLECAEHRLYQ